MSTCNLTGSLISLSGAPLVGARVFVRRNDPGNKPPFVGAAAVGDAEISLTTDAAGVFSLTLVQGAPIVIRIPDLALHFQTVVPAAANVTLKELVDASL
jgi:hypothetical protein